MILTEDIASLAILDSVTFRSLIFTVLTAFVAIVLSLTALSAILISVTDLSANKLVVIELPIINLAASK